MPWNRWRRSARTLLAATGTLRACATNLMKKCRDGPTVTRENLFFFRTVYKEVSRSKFNEIDTIRIRFKREPSHEK